MRRARRRCPCCLLLSIRLRLQSKWLYRRAAAKPSIEQYYMLQSDMYWSLSFGLIKCLQYSNTLNRNFHQCFILCEAFVSNDGEASY
jgi:hypothetical protein